MSVKFSRYTCAVFFSYLKMKAYKATKRMLKFCCLYCFWMRLAENTWVHLPVFHILNTICPGVVGARQMFFVFYVLHYFCGKYYHVSNVFEEISKCIAHASHLTKLPLIWLRYQLTTIWQVCSSIFASMHQTSGQHLARFVTLSWVWLAEDGKVKPPTSGELVNAKVFVVIWQCGKYELYMCNFLQTLILGLLCLKGILGF